MVGNARWVVLVVVVGAVASAAPPRDLEAEVKQFGAEVRAACDGHDYKAWAAHFDDHEFSVENIEHRWTKPEIWKMNCDGPSPAVTRRTLDLKVQAWGDTVLASYIWEWTTEHNGKPVVEKAMMLDTYVRRAGKLLQVGSAEMAIYPPGADPAVATVDQRVLETYVGEYEWSPGKVLTITRDGARLLGKGWMDSEAEEFFAENESTFFQKGQGWRQLFVKDASGKVTHAVFRNHGLDIEMKKVK